MAHITLKITSNALDFIVSKFFMTLFNRNAMDTVKLRQEFFSVQ